MRIAVLSNGFHTDIAIPETGRTLEALGLSRDDYPINHTAVRYWALGWGSRTAYTSLIDIRDLSIGIIAKALAFDESVMHVLPVGALPEAPGVHFVDLDAAQHERLIRDLRSWFVGDRRPLTDVTQGFGDRFYRSRGRFTPWHGCNTWTGRRLRAVGVPVGRWTVTAQSLDYGLAAMSEGVHE